MQAVAIIGLGGFLAYFLIKWLTFKHIPSLIDAFKAESAAERKLYKEELALERAMHLEAIRIQSAAVQDLASEVRKLAQDARSGRSRS